MSLAEPLLPKEKVESQKVEKYSNDPLTNFESNIEKLSVEFESFELDGASDIEFRKDGDEDYYYPNWMNRDVKCAASLGNKLAIGRIDGIIKIYDLDTKEEIVLRGHNNAVNCLQATYKKDFLVSGSRDATIIVWNLETYKQERVFKAEYEVFLVEVTSQYEIFSASLSHIIIQKWNFWDENDVITLSGHQRGITCMKCDQNNYYLVTGSEDSTLRIWSIQNCQELNSLHQIGVPDYVAVTPNSKYIVSGTDSCQIYILNTDDFKIIKQIELSGYKTMFLDVNIEYDCLWIKDGEDALKIYNIENQSSIIVKDKITAIACSKTKNLVYYGRKDKTLIIFDLKKNSPIAELKDFENKAYKMLVIGDQDEYLASIMKSGKIKIHKIFKENKIKEDISLEVSTLKDTIKFTRDGKHLICFDYTEIKIWNLIDKKYIFSYSVSSLRDLKLSNDEKYFAFIAKIDGWFIYVFSFQDMKEVSKIDLEVEGYKQFCFSITNDNQFIVVGKFDGTIAVYDIESKTKTRTLEGGNSRIAMLQINENYEHFITADEERNLVFWSFPRKKLQKVSI